MVNVTKLRDTIDAKGTTIDDVAKAIGMDRATLYRRLQREGETFSVGEIQRIKDALKLSKKQAVDIFFSK